MTDLIAELEAVNGASRFWCKVDKSGPDGCWLWMASKSNRYGQFAIGKRVDGNFQMIKAHRVAFELAKGKIPDGLHIDHLCRIRHCVNPDHLEAVTCRENILRGVSPSAIAARKTHCLHGHAFEGSNLYIKSIGEFTTERVCLVCRCMRLKQYRTRKAALKARQAMEDAA